MATYSTADGNTGAPHDWASDLTNLGMAYIQTHAPAVPQVPPAPTNQNALLNSARGITTDQILWGVAGLVAVVLIIKVSRAF